MRIRSRAWSEPYAQILQKIIRPIRQRQPFFLLKNISGEFDPIRQRQP